MLLPLLAVFLIAASLGGWFIARRPGRRYAWLTLWALLPLMPYLALGVFGIVSSSPSSRAESFAWWLIGFGYVGLPLLVWAISAVVGFGVGLLRDNAET